jgi:hypothetical protein
VAVKLTGHKTAEIHRNDTHHALAVLRQQIQKVPPPPSGD